MIVVYYILLRPISLIPIRILYLCRYPVYLLIFKIFQYRNKTIDQNIYRSFPHKSIQDRNTIKKEFQKFFVTLLIESIKNIDISKQDLKSRFQFENGHILHELFKEKKSVVLISSHYNNWEWLITSLGIHFNHQIYGIGMPLSNKFFNKKINAKRERFGLTVIDSQNYKSILKNCKEPFAVLTLADQSPSKSENAYWLNFLAQNTGVIFGPEYIANQFDTAVVYLKIERISVGNYKCNIQLLEKDVKKLGFGKITEQHVGILESQIIQNPSNWLWSHKRWKRKLPENLKSLYEHQKLKFNQKFRI